MLLPGCQRPSSEPSLLIEFSEANSLGVDVEKARRPGGAFSNIIELRSPQPVRITALSPIADDGLHVRYLGACFPGCPGAVGVGNGIRTARENRVAMLPLDLIPGSRQVKLAFVLEPDGAEGRERLRDQCLRLTALEVTLEDGSRQEVRFCCGPFINAIHPPGDSEDYAGCEGRRA